MNNSTINKDVMDALAKLMTPVGVSSEKVAEYLGISKRRSQATLGRLDIRVKQIFSLNGWNQKHYFLTASARDNAIDRVAQIRKDCKAAAKKRASELRAKRYKTKYAADEKFREAAKEHARKSRLNKKKPKPIKLIQPKIIEAPVRIAKPKPGGPARMEGEADYSKAKWTIAPKPPEKVFRTNTHKLWG